MVFDLFGRFCVAHIGQHGRLSFGHFAVLIDDQIVTVADNWRIDRMAPADRDVIRMACYEMQFIGTPKAVVLNEAVELAKEFGSEHSPSFVNGILDRIAADVTTESGS